MKHNYITFFYRQTLKKYQKYYSRLQRHLVTGSLSGLSAARKSFLLNKINELRTKLNSIQGKITTAATIAGVALTMNANAQNQLVPNYTKNPFGPNLTVQNRFGWTNQTVGDLDGDGDMDVIMGNGGDAGFLYYKNTGTKSQPVFEVQTGSNNPMDGFTGFTYSDPKLTDLDGDGDLDIISSYSKWDYDIQLNYYKNIGTTTNPVFTQETGTANPFPLVTGYFYYTSVSSADIDGDGDTDVLFTNSGNHYAFFLKNTGTATAPAFMLETGSSNPFPSGDIIPSSYSDDYAQLDFADIDSDGDYDLLVGQENYEMLLYKNIGTATSAVFQVVSGSDNPFSKFVMQWQDPTFVDLNDDGVKDLIIGTKHNTLIYLNKGTTTQPAFELPMLQRSDVESVEFADMDGDGDMDMLRTHRGLSDDEIYFVNNGTTSSPSFVAVTGSDNPFAGIYSQLRTALIDMDGDGDLDLVSTYHGPVYYENTGSSTAAQFELRTGTDSPFNGLNSYSAFPVFADLDGDNDLDFIGAYSNDLLLYVNTGSKTSPNFVLQTGTNNVLENVDAVNPYCSFADLDQDGDLDLIVGSNYYIHYFENTGTSSAAAFTERTGTDNIIASQDDSYLYYAPAFLDVDGDGDQDLFVGEKYGIIKLYENVPLSIPTPVVKTVTTSFNKEVEAFPNPARTALSVRMNDALGEELKVSVVDLTGVQKLSDVYVNNGGVFTIDVSGLEKGMYLIKVTSASKTSVKKFVKE